MKVVGLILNRNCQELGDSCYEMIAPHCDQTFMLENGSTEGLFAKNSNLFVKETHGVSWGVNYLFKHALEHTDADVFWLNFNDAGFDCDQKDFRDFAISEIKSDPRIGIITGYWDNVWNLAEGRKNAGDELVSFFDPLTFFITRQCLEGISTLDKRLTPFYDPSNFTNHYNGLGPALALYSLGFKIKTSQIFRVHEVNVYLEADKEEKSLDIRGFNDDYWKHDLGPAQATEWLDSFFPDLKDSGLSIKQKRDAAIDAICRIAKSKGI